MIPKIPAKKHPSDVVTSASIDIDAPINLVFSIIGNPLEVINLEDIVHQVSIISERKQGKGTKTRWVSRDFETGKEAVYIEEIYHYEPPFQMAYRVISGPQFYTGIHTLSKNPDGTTLHEFNEVFHFPGNYDELLAIIQQNVHNVKRIAEKRHHTKQRYSCIKKKK